MTLHHEAAEGSVVSAAQGRCCLGRAPDLTHDMPCAPEALLAHQVSASWGGKGVSGPATHHLWALPMWGWGSQGGGLGVGGWGAVLTKLHVEPCVGD